MSNELYGFQHNTGLLKTAVGFHGMISLYSVTFPSSPLTRNYLVKMFSFLSLVITRRSELEKNKENKLFLLTTFP